MIILKSKNKGFSLIEVLAVIFIISLLFGISFYYVNNAISRSRDSASVLSKSSIEKSASLYVQEYNDKVVWEDNKTCVSIDDLVKTGYVKERQKDSLLNENIFSVNLFKSNGVISSKASDTDCNGRQSVPVPTSKKYCNDLEYNTKEQTLVKSASENFVWTGTITRSNAGSYKVNAKLNNQENYVWSDGTNNEKTITCTIKKAIPILTFDSYGQTNGNVGDSNTVTVSSNGVQGKLTVKSSNSNYVIGEINKDNNLVVTTLASRKDIITYLYVTLTPNDTNNYYTTTVVYTIGDVNLIKVNSPKSSWCENNTYNGNSVNLIRADYIKKNGILFDKTTAIQSGLHYINVSLKYGYVWEDGTFNSKKLSCSIQKANSSIKVISVSSDKPDVFEEIEKNKKSNLLKDNSLTITLESNVPGTIRANSLNNSILVDNVSSDKSGMVHYVTVTGISIMDDYKDINITFSPVDNLNYYASTIGYKLKVIPFEYNITYDYNFAGTIDNKKYLDTGYKVNWDNDFTINTSFKVSRLGQRYLIVGGFDNNSTKELNLEVTTDNHIRVYVGKGSVNKSSSKTISVDKNINLKFVWNSSEQQISVFVNNDVAPWIQVSHSISGSSNNTLVMGTCDQRPSCSTFKNIDISSFKITNTSAWNKLSNSDLLNATRIGHTFNGWYTASSNGSKVTSNDVINSDRTIYAHWTINKVKIKFHMNGGSLASEHGSSFTRKGDYILKNGSDIVTSINYGGSISNLSNYNWSGGINIIKTGYHALSEHEWISDSGKTFNQADGVVYRAEDFCNAEINDCTVTLKVNWVINKVKIKFHMNGGSLAYEHGSSFSSNGNYILKDGSDIVTSIDYDKTVSNLSNYNWSGGINITRYGYHALSEHEWISDSGKTFNQADGAVVYKAKDFCNAEKNDCTVTLKVNWVVNKVRVRLHANQGNLNTTSTNYKLNDAGYIQKTLDNGSKTIDFYTIPFGGSISRLASNTVSNHINLVRSGWHIIPGREWISFYTGRTFAAGDYHYYYDDFNFLGDADSYDTLKANWEKDGAYVVTYYSNGGSNPPSAQTKYHGQPLTLSWWKPTRSNYIFKEWNTQSNGKGTKYTPGQTYSDNKNLNLYAQWTAVNDTSKINLTINYDPATGTSKAGVETSVTYGNVSASDRITDLKKVENLFNKPSSLTGTLVGDAVKGEEWVISGTNVTLNQNGSYEVRSLMQWGNCSGNSCTITLCAHWDANSLLIGTYKYDASNVGFWIYSPNPDYQIRSLYVGGADSNFVNNILTSSYKTGYETMRNAGIYTHFSKGASISSKCTFTDYSFSCYSNKFFGSTYGAICVELENIVYPGRYYYCHAVSKADYDGSHTSFSYGAVRLESVGVSKGLTFKVKG